MNRFARNIKAKFNRILHEMSLSVSQYVKKPGVDFTRNYKLPFKKTILTIVMMGGLNLNRELLRVFNYNTYVPTASAFVQQRDKILPEAFSFLFREFTDSLPQTKGFNGYDLYAVDGSDITIYRNPKDISTYIQNGENAKGYNLLHINALYDLQNRLYKDFIVQKAAEKNETKALMEMANRLISKRKPIILGDRGYESYNVFAHLEKFGLKYAIRVKDIRSTGILSGLKLPDGEFDVDISMKLTRRQTKEVKRNPDKYKIVPSTTTFDHFDRDGFCQISFRVVRFKLKTGEYEVIITNLSRDEFPPEKIKELYNKRWGIETSFRKLKYTIGLSALHARKADSILQEIAARMLMYNFCEVIVTNIIIQNKDRKYHYQVNFTTAAAICLKFFRCRGAKPPNVTALIMKCILPIRPDRSAPRVVKSKGAYSFVYRIA